MKYAKVTKGLIQKVWPWEKTLPDGTRVVKELPPQYQGLRGKSVPDCIIEVPDDVQPGWAWNEAQQRYAPVVKKLRPEPRSDIVQVISEKLGITYDELWNEIIALKNSRRTPPD